jgi:23S rRNA (adenine2503-C2)-methyltransferase
MPFSVNFPLTALQESIEYWYSKTKERVTYEYVVWNDVNDSIEDVKALMRFCKDTPCKVNLIEYNPVGDDRFAQAKEDAIELYVSQLTKHQIPVTIRRSRGKDIDAACGQLANKAIS